MNERHLRHLRSKLEVVELEELAWWTTLVVKGQSDLVWVGLTVELRGTVSQTLLELGV